MLPDYVRFLSISEVSRKMLLFCLRMGAMTSAVGREAYAHILIPTNISCLFTQADDTRTRSCVEHCAQKKHCVSSMAKRSVKTEYHSNHTRKRTFICQEILETNKEKKMVWQANRFKTLRGNCFVVWMMLDRNVICCRRTALCISSTDYVEKKLLEWE